MPSSLDRLPLSEASGFSPPPAMSPVHSVFSSSSDESYATSNVSPIAESPQIYDAILIPSVHPRQASRVQRPSLLKLKTSTDISLDHTLQHPVLREDPTLNRFFEGTRCFHQIFKLSANRFRSISTLSTDEALRLATWWLIHGRSQLKLLVSYHTSTKHVQTQREQNVLIGKSRINLAKSIWLLHEHHLEYATSEALSDSITTEGLQALLTALLKCIHLMGRHGLLITNDMDTKFSPDIDGTIWIEYPTIGVGIEFLLTGQASCPAPETNTDYNGTLADQMPLETTQSYFHYASLLVDTYILSDASNSQQVKYPSILSVVRRKQHGQISLILHSQNGQLNVSIEPVTGLHSTWDNVTWLQVIDALELKLPTGFRLQVRCSETDFKMLSKMYRHYNHANMAYEVGDDEELLFESNIASVDFHSATDDAYEESSPVATSDCRLRLFHRVITRAEGTGPRKMYRGTRIVILTPTSKKNLCILEYYIQPAQIIEFGYLPSTHNQQSIFLKADIKDPPAMTILNFNDSQNCRLMLAHLTGIHLSQNEVACTDMLLRSFSIAVGTDILVKSSSLGPSPFNRLRVFNSKLWHESDFDVESSSTVLSPSLRLVLDSPDSRLTDRFNVDIGELRLRRNVLASGHELHILREPQKDMTYSQSAEKQTPEDRNDLQATLSAIIVQPSMRSYSFYSMSDLHQFQAAITGYSVIFDGVPASFSISRRRLLVPKSKEWESPHARIQILKRKEIYQLVAFFEGFKHGKCMNFELRKTDMYKMIKAGNKTLVRLVNAKFPLPRGDYKEQGMDQGFVCIDALDYASVPRPIGSSAPHEFSILGNQNSR